MIRKFNADELVQEMRSWTDGPKHVLVCPESSPELMHLATEIRTEREMLLWITEFPYQVGTFWITTDEDLLNDMKTARPELDLRLVPVV